MSIHQFTLGALALWLMLTASAHITLAQGPVDPPKENYLPGEVLVKFKPGVGVQDTRQRVAAVPGVKHVKKSTPATGAITLAVEPGREQEAIANLQARSDVVYAEPNYIAYALDTPTDPAYSLQWGPQKINLPQALSITGGGDSSLIVAIVDTGIDLDHPDFICTVSSGASKLTAGYDFANKDTIPDDGYGHGTHVAGIVGACGNNGVGITGIAPNVRLMPVKVLRDDGLGSFADVADGIVYAADHGAKIINLSLGGTSDSSYMYEAIEYAYNRGVLVVAAAGNYAQSGNPIFYPAAYAETMAVAATDSYDNRASFSEYHPYVDIAAPGASIYSTAQNGSYKYLSGTSMATPHVAGLAALIWSMAPGYTADQIRNVITTSAIDLGAAGRDDYYGYGRIDAFNALDEFMVLGVTQTNGSDPVNAIGFLADAQTPAVATRQLSLVANLSEPVNWQVQLSPAVDWVSITSATSGQLTAAAGASPLTLTATQPATYGNYHTTLIITGSTASGINFAPVNVDISFTYVPELQQYYLPLIFR